MNYSIILDCIAVAILVISVVVMARRGILKSVYKISSIILTVVAVLIFSEPAMGVLENTGFDTHIDKFVSTAIVGDVNTQIEENSGYDTGILPQYFDKAIESATENALVPAVSSIVKKLICAVAIYLLIKIILYLLFFVVEGVLKLPVLRSVNKLVGIAAGLLSGFIIIYLACGIASLNIANSAQFREIVDNTYLVKYFYDGNILMSLFLSIN